MSASWYVALWRTGRWIVTRVLFPGITVAAPFVFAFGLLRPDANAISALSLRAHEVALLVGFGGGEKCTTGTTPECSMISNRTYLIVPSLSGAGVIETPEGVQVMRMPGMGIIILMSWVIGGWCVARYWIQPMSSNLRWSGHSAQLRSKSGSVDESG